MVLHVAFVLVYLPAFPTIPEHSRILRATRLQHGAAYDRPRPAEFGGRISRSSEDEMSLQLVETETTPRLTSAALSVTLIRP